MCTTPRCRGGRVEVMVSCSVSSVSGSFDPGLPRAGGYMGGGGRRRRPWQRPAALWGSEPAQDTRPSSNRTAHDRETLAVPFLNCWAEPHLSIILRILLKYLSSGMMLWQPDPWKAGLPFLLKAGWRLDSESSWVPFTFVAGRLLTQNEEGKKRSPRDEKKREKPQSWG